jgi:hypothetical protein
VVQPPVNALNFACDALQGAPSNTIAVSDGSHLN